MYSLCAEQCFNSSSCAVVGRTAAVTSFSLHANLFDDRGQVSQQLSTEDGSSYKAVRDHMCFFNSSTDAEMPSCVSGDGDGTIGLKSCQSSGFHNASVHDRGVEE